MHVIAKLLGYNSKVEIHTSDGRINFSSKTRRLDGVLINYVPLTCKTFFGWDLQGCRKMV